MTAGNHIEVERLFPHPVTRVFRRYTDHAGWSDWAGVGRVRLVREGSPDRNGVGSVRAFSAPPSLREEVTVFEPPPAGRGSARMEYRVIQGAFPLADHLGTVTFTPEGEGTRLRWEVSFRSRIPGLGGLIVRGLRVVFDRMLSGLARDLDRHA
jgi:uncharacterized protein YndB with AHSA1/START domain